MALIAIGTGVLGALRSGPLRIPLIACGASHSRLVVRRAAASDRDADRNIKKKGHGDAVPFIRILRNEFSNYADADFTCVNAAATSLISGTTGMS